MGEVARLPPSQSVKLFVSTKMGGHLSCRINLILVGREGGSLAHFSRA